MYLELGGPTQVRAILPPNEGAQRISQPTCAMTANATGSYGWNMVE